MHGKGLHMEEDLGAKEAEPVRGWTERLFVTSVLFVWGAYLLGLVAVAIYMFYS